MLEMTEKLMENNRLLQDSEQEVSDLETRLEMESEKVETLNKVISVLSSISCSVPPFQQFTHCFNMSYFSPVEFTIMI